MLALWRQATGARFACRVARIPLGLRGGLESQLGGEPLFFLDLCQPRPLGSFSLGLDARGLLFGCLACTLFGFSSQPFLLLARLLGFALFARFENSPPFRLLCEQGRIVSRRL